MQHDLLTLSVPTLTIVLAALLNRADISKLRSELNEKFETFQGEVRSDLGNVRSDLGDIRAQQSVHTEQFASIRERLARLEER